MKKALQKDKLLVLDILTASFNDNQSVNYIIKQDKKRIERIRQLMSYSFEICSIFGDVWLSDDHSACALIVYPEKKRTTIHSTLLDLQLIFRAIGFSNIRKTLGREKLISNLQPKEPTTYLWFIGVSPSAQRQGAGTKLLQEIITFSRQVERIVLLETSAIQNIPWYEKNGFELYEELDLGYRLLFFKHRN